MILIGGDWLAAKLCLTGNKKKLSGNLYHEQVKLKDLLSWQEQGSLLTPCLTSHIKGAAAPRQLKQQEQGLASPSVTFFLGAEGMESRNSLLLSLVAPCCSWST